MADAFDGERFVGLTLRKEGASVGPERLLVSVDAGRVNRDVGTFTEFVLPLLKNVPGARARLTLEIVVEFEDGCDAEKVDEISKLCDDMKYREFGFGN